jgi:hypothetical protein
MSGAISPLPHTPQWRVWGKFYLLQIRVLRNIFVPRREEISGEWIILYEGTSLFVPLAKGQDGQIMEDEVIGIRGMQHERQDTCIQNFDGKAEGKRDTWHAA